MTKLKREVHIRPAFDKRDPSPSKNYGIHGAEMIFLLHGDKGVVQFVVFTNWHLPHVQKELEAKPSDGYNWLSPTPVDIGYHSPLPMYEGQTIASDVCEYIGGKPCYYDGSGLQAEEYFNVLVAEGSDALWDKMEKYYKELFESEE